MAVTIAPNAEIVIKTAPKINVTPDLKDNAASINTAEMMFTCDVPLTAEGQVTLVGEPGDSTDGWVVGFIQAQWIETSWMYYRGKKNENGSIFLQRARPPARPAQACRDVNFGAPPHSVFFNPSPGANGIKRGWPTTLVPHTFAVTHSDSPDAEFRVLEQNHRTNQPNFLTEAQVEYHFCTVLTAQDPQGKFHHQASFYWNVRWQAKFKINPDDVQDFTATILPKSSGGTAGRIVRGEPIDSRFTGVLTGVVTKNCKEIADAAVDAVDSASSPNRHEATTWQNFDVRQP